NDRGRRAVALPVAEHLGVVPDHPGAAHDQFPRLPSGQRPWKTGMTGTRRSPGNLADPIPRVFPSGSAGGRASSLPAELPGWLAGFSLEDDAEVLRVLEADQTGDVVDRVVGLGEKLLGATELDGADLGVRRVAPILPEASLQGHPRERDALE